MYMFINVRVFTPIDDKGDVAIDNLLLIPLSCEGIYLKLLNITVTFTCNVNSSSIFAVLLERSKAGKFSNSARLQRLPWRCNFGETLETIDWCNFKQDDTDRADWTAIVGGTPTPRTGPPESSLEAQGM